MDDEVNDVLKTFEQNLAKQNLDLDTYLKINSREKEDFIEKDIKPAARKRLEHSLVIDEISHAEKIELDQKELQQEYARSFMQMQSAPDFQKLQKQFTTRKLANVTVMQAASRLMNLKTLQRLKAYANGEEIPAPEQTTEGANGEEKTAKPAKAKKPAAKKEA